jgi:hypothetical protein
MKFQICGQLLRRVMFAINVLNGGKYCGRRLNDFAIDLPGQSFSASDLHGITFGGKVTK